MTWVLGLLAVLVLGGVALVAAGRGAPLADADDDLPDPGLPDGPLGPGDLRAVRFPLVLRGYRMADVDALLDRLADQLDAGRDAGADDVPDAPGGGSER